jgi:hydrogenase/urease accessory protein HupE
VLQAIVLLAMGLPLICTCGYIELWHGNPSGPETSQHLTDWYTYTHVLHGIGFYLFFWLIAPRMPFTLRLALAIGLEVAWEVAENTPFVMARYRQSALARGYFGDSVINSVFDTLAATLGFVLARVLPVWPIITLVVAVELSLGFMIRDNLTLNIVQLIHPSEAISRWQMGQ